MTSRLNGRESHSGIALLVLLLGVNSLSFWFAPPTQIDPLYLSFQLSAAHPCVAEIFFNTGVGFNEKETWTQRIDSRSLSEFSTVRIPLPPKTIYEFRLDPANSEGEFIVRNLVFRDASGHFQPLSEMTFVPFHQIKELRQKGSEFEVRTTPGADDPGIQIRLARPVSRTRRLNTARFCLLLTMNAAFIVLWALSRRHAATIGELGIRILKCLQSLNASTTSLAARMSSPEFLRFDALAIWVYVFCICSFLGSVANNLNGSSSAMMHSMFKRGAGETMLLGEPRAIRSDEWGYATPDVLSQALRTDRFAVTSSDLGGHSVALLGNLPVAHWTVLLRPQFWGFFVLPVSYGYSFFWQSKALILVSGIFTWLLMISGSSRWALTGTIWFFFSPSTQWSYSWPSGLPEMIGLSCLATVGFCYLVVGRSMVALQMALVVTVACSLNFAFCAYLPQMVPLAWLQMAVIVSWCIARYPNILASDCKSARAWGVGLALILIAALGALFYGEVRVAVSAIGNTIYPGQRLVGGGTVPFSQLIAHMLPWGLTEERFPVLLGSVSEASGFLWLAPFTLLCLGRVQFSLLQRAIYIALLVYFSAILAWLILPLPASLGSLFLLNRTFGARCMPSLGLANVALVCVYLASRKEDLRRGFGHFSMRLGAGVMVWGAMLIVTTAMNQHLDHFFSQKETVSGSFFVSLIFFLMAGSERLVLSSLLVASHVWFFGAINPIKQGVQVFTSSALYRFMHRDPALTRDQWMIYSDSPVLSGFFAAVGCQIYTGTHYLPDIDHFFLYKARGLDVNAFNRLGYTTARLPDADGRSKVQVINPVVVEWKIAPTDPLLRQIGIRYIALDAAGGVPPKDLTTALIPLSSQTVDGFWLYSLP